MKRIAILSLPVLLLALAACGEKGSGTDAAGASGSGDPALVSAPSAPAAQGADSPEAVMAKARAFADAQDFRGMVGLVAPADRPLMSLGMVMVAKMAPMMMGGLGGGFGDEAKAEMDKKLKPFSDAMDGVMKKHGLDKLDMEQGPPGGISDPDAAAKWIDEQVPGLDHGAVVADVIEAMGALGGEAQGKATDSLKKFGGELTDLQVDGDTATGKVDAKAMAFRKVDGRWYLSIRDQMGR